jgi:hypothetical protein
LKIAVVTAVAALLASGCGAQTGRYAKFTNWGDARDWEVWRQADGRYFFRSTDFVGTHYGSCVDGGRIIELDGRTVRDTYEGEYFPPGSAHYPTRKSAWAELSNDFFDQRQVEQALAGGTDRARPKWLRGFDHCKFKPRRIF